MSHCHDEEHEEGHNHSHEGHDHDGPDRGEQSSLFKVIDVDRIRAFNVCNDEESARKVFKPWDKRFDHEPYLESDSDNQLIIFVPFTGMVKLKSILIMGGPNEMMPKTLKVFTNREDVDFDSVDTTTPLQEWGLIDTTTTAAREIPEYPTRMAKFTSVRNITLFISNNYGDEKTRISYIAFKGEWTELKKDPLITIGEFAANPADHIKLQGKHAVDHMIR
ncbi:hypothetical protein SmJEL517_g03305 [Synchytrium microbalum]|uniref:PITH domain-containing protein n=1 Tax=Synchytrium microbalum TaxID=1806994 RepID=A0A507C764_9FUNG|nr:uncharacterized protein SmJEL517_g03305 [Synchytrium microbalum]TPX33836.1 hypothetical protein SmJEL517_g03305 [Synchytrium microbalum]